MILDGRQIAAQLRADVATRIAALGYKPGLAVIFVGDDPASQIYVRGKQKACADVGIDSTALRLPVHTTPEELENAIRDLNDNPKIHGILLQLPLPPHLNADHFLSLIDPKKDVDGLHPANLGLLLAGRPGLVPCTPRGVMHLIQTVCPDLSGLHAVVVGRSVLVGRPLAQLLLAQNCTVVQAHSKTKNLGEETRRADILIAAVGHPKLITPDMVKPGAIVIDVGITRTETGLEGDVDFETVKEIARAITPVPGGVGPMTIACLLENTLQAAMVK